MPQRGQKTSKEEKIKILHMIQEAIAKGVRKSFLCKKLNLSIRTIQRWEKCLDDKRKGPQNPKNKLSQTEKAHVTNLLVSSKFVDLPPSKIVPLLADEGTYICSESTMYRILRQEKMLKYRSRAKRCQKRERVNVISHDQIRFGHGI